MAGALGLTQQDVYDFCLSELGYPSVAVHVTPDQVQKEINHVVGIYSRRKPAIRYATIGASVARQDYTPDPSKIGYGIMSVGIPRLDPIAPLLLSAGPRLDIFGYRYSYPYRDIAELEIDYMYFDMATRVLSADIDWEFIDGKIWIYPAPQDSFQFSYSYACPKTLGDDVTQTPATFRPHDEDIIRSMSSARVKMIEGRILRRYRSIPGATASMATDGDDLVSEGQSEWTVLLKELEDRTPELPFIKNTSTDLPLQFG
jgi:hypothetical protein